MAGVLSFNIWFSFIVSLLLTLPPLIGVYSAHLDNPTLVHVQKKKKKGGGGSRHMAKGDEEIQKLRHAWGGFLTVKYSTQIWWVLYFTGEGEGWGQRYQIMLHCLSVPGNPEIDLFSLPSSTFPLGMLPGQYGALYSTSHNFWIGCENVYLHVSGGLFLSVVFTLSGWAGHFLFKFFFSYFPFLSFV